MLLDGKVAIVTGAGKGIGKSIALALAEEGANIAAVDINLQDVETVSNEIIQSGFVSTAISCDISRVQDIENMISTVVDRFGKIDILVNNAGIAKNMPIEDISEDEWDRVIDVNLKGTFFCSKLAFIEMKKTGGGRIINMASISGERGGRFAGVNYSASKAGVIVMTKCFALRGGEVNINVNAVAPGVVDTEMTRQLGTVVTDVPLGRPAKPEEIADAVVFLASDKSSYITGSVLDVNGGQLMR